MQINTNNTKAEKSALQIVSGASMVLNAQNDGSVDLNAQIDASKLSGDSLLCINNTCVSASELTKAKKIYVEPPDYKQIGEIRLKGVISLNLNNYFTDKSGGLTYSLVDDREKSNTTPYNNVILNGSTLTITGDFRNVSYTVGVKATNRFGGSTTIFIPIRETARINCQYEWLRGNCDIRTGTRTTKLSISVPAEDGTPCPTETTKTEKCDVDCVLTDNWEPVGPCDPYSGTQTFQKRVLVEPKNNGKPCGPTTKQEPCPVNCSVSGWGGWSGCDPYSGTQWRSRSVIISAKNGGAACPHLTESQNCPVNCVMGGWSPCYGRTQYRDILIHPKNGGAGCGPTSSHCEMGIATGWEGDTRRLGCPDGKVIRASSFGYGLDGRYCYASPAVGYGAIDYQFGNGMCGDPYYGKKKVFWGAWVCGYN